MINNKLLIKTFALFIIIGLLDYVGNTFYLHWTEWWFDVMLHFLSGGAVAMFLISVGRSFSSLKSSDITIIIVTILGTLLIGILWEIFELYFNITFFSDGVFYWRDTISDLIMDVCGGFFATLYSIKIIIRSNELKHE